MRVRFFRAVVGANVLGTAVVAGFLGLVVPVPDAFDSDRSEAAGEVQTPLLGEAALRLRIGDRVYMRHAKAGELAEHFNRLLLVEGDRIAGEAPTYRGEGFDFL